jgi:hypothetical protein
MSDRMQAFKEKGPEEKAVHVIPDGSKKAKEQFYVGVEQAAIKNLEEKSKKVKKKTSEETKVQLPEAVKKIFDRTIVNDEEAVSFGEHYTGLEHDGKKVKKIYVLISAKDIDKQLAEFNEWSKNSGYRYTLSNPQSAKFTEADIQFLIQAGKIGFGLETEKGEVKKPVQMPKEIKEPEKRPEMPVQKEGLFNLAEINNMKQLIETNKKMFEDNIHNRTSYITFLIDAKRRMAINREELEKENEELQDKKTRGELASADKKRINEIPKIQTKLAGLIDYVGKEVDKYPVIISIDVKE